MKLKSNVWFLKIKLSPLKREIFEEMLTVNGCDASYWCCYRFIVDFHPLKGKWQRKECMQYNVRIKSHVWLLKIKLTQLKRELFDEMFTVNGCEASIVVFTVLLGDLHTLKVELTKEIMHAIQFEAYK